MSVIPRDPPRVVASLSTQSLLRIEGRSVDVDSASETQAVTAPRSTSAIIPSSFLRNTFDIDSTSPPQPTTTDHPNDDQTPHDGADDAILPGSQVSLGQMPEWLTDGTQWLDGVWLMFPPASQPQTTITPRRTVLRGSAQDPAPSPTQAQLREPFPMFIRPDAVEKEQDVVMEEEPLVETPQQSPRRSKRNVRPPPRPESDGYY